MSWHKTLIFIAGINAGAWLNALLVGDAASMGVATGGVATSLFFAWLSRND